MSLPHHPFSGFRLTPKNFNSGKIVLLLGQTTSVMETAKWLSLSFNQKQNWERDVNLQHISVLPTFECSKQEHSLRVPDHLRRNNLPSKKHRGQHIAHHNHPVRENPHLSLNTKYFAFLLNVTLLGKKGIQGPETYYFCVIKLYIWIQLS